MKELDNKYFAQIKNATLGLALLSYAALFCYFSLSHHRWFDEAQSWLVAQNNSIPSLIKALSLEGHPFLWYSVIYFPAKVFGFSSLTYITTAIYTISCIYIFTKSPFPLIFKIILPLNYYFFYQYGIISRSYSLFILLSLLAADSYSHRFSSTKFLAFTALMSAVSFHSAIMSIGILFSFGLELSTVAIVSRRISKAWRQNTLLLIGAIIFAVVNIYSILPPQDQYFITHITKNDIDFKRFYIVATEGILGNAAFWTNKFINNASDWFQLREFIVLIVSILFYGNLFRLACSWPTFLYVSVPLFGLFLGLLFFYANIYHFGLICPSLLFSFWIVLVSRRKQRIGICSACFFFAFAVVGLLWTVKSVVFEQANTYSGLKDAAEYISTHNIKPLSTDSVNALGVNAFIGKNVFENVFEKPYFVWSKNGNIDKTKNTAVFILTNVLDTRDKLYCRLVKEFPGNIHSKGLKVSNDDTFYLYELKKH